MNQGEYSRGGGQQVKARVVSKGPAQAENLTSDAVGVF